MAESFAIFGVSALSELIASYLHRMGVGVVSEFVVEQKYLAETTKVIDGVISWENFCKRPDFHKKKMIFAVGYKDPSRKAALFDQLTQSGALLMNLDLSENGMSNIQFSGNGNILLPGVTIEPGSDIGDGNVFWSGSHICHDSEIGNFNFLSAKSVLGGNVKIGHRGFIGLSAVIRNNVQICDDVVVGMGAVVVSPIVEPGTYYGNPAKKHTEL